MHVSLKDKPRLRIDPKRLKDIASAIVDRRATLEFKSDPIPDDDLEDILQLAAQAPSGYNLQPWRFIVVRDPENRTRLRKAAMNQPKVEQAPVVVIGVGMKEEPLEMAEEILRQGAERGAGRPGQTAAAAAQARGFLGNGIRMDVWANRHVMIAMTTMMIAAEACGYDTAPMEGFDPEAVKREFGIPDEAEVVCLLAIGKAREPEKPYPGRFGLDQIAFREHFGNSWSQTSNGTVSKTREEPAVGR